MFSNLSALYLLHIGPAQGVFGANSSAWQEEKKEGGRDAVMRLPMTEKQSVRPEHTDHSHAHINITARE